MIVLPSSSELRAERCRRSFAAFIAEAWPVIEPATPFVSGWHIEVIAEHLEAASRAADHQHPAAAHEVASGLGLLAGLDLAHQRNLDQLSCRHLSISRAQ